MIEKQVKEFMTISGQNISNTPHVPHKKLKKFKEIQNRNISFLCSYQNHQNNLTDFKLFIENLLNLNLLSGVDIMLENFNTPHEFINIKNLSDWLKLKRLKLSKD